MKLTDIRNSINEISAIGGLKMVVKGNTKEVEGIKLSKEMAQAMIDWFNSSPYGRKYPKAAKGPLHISLGIMMSFGLERYAKHKGAKEELKYIKGLSKRTNESVVNEAKVEFKKDDLVYNKRTKTVGIVRDVFKDGGGDLRTDADGVVNIDELEKYNPIKNKNHSNAKVAPSTEKEVNKRGLFNPFKNESVVNEDDNPCWKNYQMVGMKKKNGKDVPNCVPEGLKEGVMSDIHLTIKSSSSEEDFIKKFFKKYGKQVKPNKESILWVKDLYSDVKNESVNESKFAGWIAGYNGKQIEIKKGEAKDLYNAKLLAIKKLKVPKSKVGLMFIKPAVDESVVNEAKYDIGMARKGNGITIYNKAEEEKGDYKNVAHIDSKGKVKYFDKKIPSNIKKQIEAEAKKMMEITKEETMKLKDILKESFENGKIYSNPFHTPFVKENDEAGKEESSEMTTEQKQAFLEAVKAYKSFGESIYRKEGLAKVYESIRGLVESAGKNMVKETEGSFDGITVSRHVKRMNESFKIFEKTLREVGTLQQRLESSYDEIGETLGKYYEISESHGEEEIEEGNEFGAARTTAIANGDSEFEVDGKTYPVKDVSKDDKDNAKEFKKENTKGNMKLKDLLNESFGIGKLPSEKLMKMKVSAKDMLASVSNKKINEDTVSNGAVSTLEKGIQRILGTEVNHNINRNGAHEFYIDDAEFVVGVSEEEPAMGKKQKVAYSFSIYDDGARKYLGKGTAADEKDLIKKVLSIAKKYKKQLLLTTESVVKEEEINEGGFATWEMRFADMNLGGVKLSKKNVYKVKARNTVEAIKKAAKMAGVEKNWIATQTHSLKKIG